MAAEGDQYMAQAITPSSAANALRVRAKLQMSTSGAGQALAALFQDATVNALKAIISIAGTNNFNCLDLEATILSATTSATTFKTRAGSNAAGTTTFNGVSAGRIFAGAMNSYMEVQEIMG